MSLISLCAIGIVVVVGIFDELNKKNNMDEEKYMDEENINDLQKEIMPDIYK